MGYNPHQPSPASSQWGMGPLVTTKTYFIMETLFRNKRTIEQLAELWKCKDINVYPKRRCLIDPVTKEKIPGKYQYFKNKNGVSIYFATDDCGHYAAVSEAVAKDIETSGQPQQTVIVQEVSQDEGNTWTLSLMYAGQGNQAPVFSFSV